MDDYINFKKPQYEMFKKLDGKIQKIVAAHSNLNKLYALNEFSSFGVGPKRPFELPPQLPPPPPWVPKQISNDVPGFSNHNNNIGATIILQSSNTSPAPQSQPQQRPETPTRQTITSSQFAMLAQKIQETLKPDEAPTSPNSGNVSAEDSFRENLVALLKKEIAAATRSANFNFNITPPRPKQSNQQRSLLLKSSPQTLFNTIKRETSLLLNKNSGQNVAAGPRSGLSLLSNQQTTMRQPNSRQFDRSIQNTRHLPSTAFNKFQTTIKIVVPPTEYNQNAKQSILDANRESMQQKRKLSDDENDDHSDNHEDSNLESIRPVLTYQYIKSKIKIFQERNQLYLGSNKQHRISPYNMLARDSNQSLKKKSSQKSIDDIVNRLQAKCSPSPTNDYADSFKMNNTSLTVVNNQNRTSLHQQSTNSSISLLKPTRNMPPTSSVPTPIPVFRTSVSTKGENGYHQPGGNTTSRLLKSKKSKRSQHLFGLKLGNYMEKECPQPTNEKISIEQFARCLDLVRTNDASLKRHQQQLSQSELKWRLPVTNRPLRLRRIRGEKIYMPASASYKATRKAGLQ